MRDRERVQTDPRRMGLRRPGSRQTESRRKEKVQKDSIQTHRIQTDRVQTDRVQTDRAPTEHQEIAEIACVVTQPNFTRSVEIISHQLDKGQTDRHGTDGQMDSACYPNRQQTAGFCPGLGQRGGWQRTWQRKR